LSKGMSAGEILACLFRTPWRTLNLPMNAEKSLRKAAKILAYACVAWKSSRP
jgi:hypothetical protein